MIPVSTRALVELVDEVVVWRAVHISKIRREFRVIDKLLRVDVFNHERTKDGQRDVVIQLVVTTSWITTSRDTLMKDI